MNLLRLVFPVVPLLVFVSGVKGVEYSLGYRSSCRFDAGGTINLILSAPHGGSVLPSDLPDRARGGCRRSDGPAANRCTWTFDDACVDGEVCPSTTVQDTLSDQFAENVAKFIWENYSYRVHLVVGQWSRKKVDFNREINEATLNHPEAMRGYQSYHSALQTMIHRIRSSVGEGLLVDVHGHGGGNYSMVGYLLNANQLNSAPLSPSARTSIDALCSATSKDECIRGEKSFGTVMEANGLGMSIPSLAHPHPEDRLFFSGGFITSAYIDRINAIQTELPSSIRTGTNKLLFAQRFAKSLIDFMKANHLLVPLPLPST